MQKIFFGRDRLMRKKDPLLELVREATLIVFDETLDCALQSGLETLPDKELKQKLEEMIGEKIDKCFSAVFGDFIGEKGKKKTMELLGGPLLRAFKEEKGLS